MKEKGRGGRKREASFCRKDGEGQGTLERTVHRFALPTPGRTGRSFLLLPGSMATRGMRVAHMASRRVRAALMRRGRGKKREVKIDGVGAEMAMLMNRAGERCIAAAWYRRTASIVARTRHASLFRSDVDSCPSKKGACSFHPICGANRRSCVGGHVQASPPSAP